MEPTTELTVPGETADYIHTSSACLHVRQQGERSLINFCIACCFLFFIYAKRIVMQSPSAYEAEVVATMSLQEEILVVGRHIIREFP